jgi:hypothetical protein
VTRKHTRSKNPQIPFDNSNKTRILILKSDKVGSSPPFGGLETKSAIEQQGQLPEV